MKEQLPTIVAFLTDLERLKLVSRASYVSDLSRRENSAEHSWHLAVGLLTVARELNLDIDVPKALIMALIHDACEIDARDTPIYGPQRSDKYEAEKMCVDRLAAHGLEFGFELRELWHEYEAQETMESRWVNVLDRLMPFIVNLATQGRTWRDYSVARSQVLRINESVRQHAPELYEWMVERVEECVEAGWLRDE